MPYSVLFSRLLTKCLAAAFGVCLLSGTAWAYQAPVPYRVLKDHDVYDLHADGRYTETIHFTIEPLTQAGVQRYSQLSKVFSGKMQSVRFLGGETLNASSKPVPVPKSSVYTRSLPVALKAPIFSDTKRMIASYPEVRIGSRLEARWEVVQKQPYFRGQVSIQHFTPYYEDAKNVRITIHVPKGMHMHWAARDGYRVVVHKTAAGETIVATLPRHHAEPLQANAVSPYQVSPAFIASTFADWKAIGDAYWGYAEHAERVTPTVRRLAKRIAGDKSGEAAVRALYNYVTTHIRWVGIETGLSGFKPVEADATLHQGYGDCKAASTLLVALLKARGIEAQPVLLEAGDSFTLDSQANLGEMNHAIAYVPRYHLYLDPTSGYAPLGALPFPDIDKPVVLVGARSRLGHTPTASRYIQHATVTLAADGTLTGKSRSTVVGSVGWQMRDLLGRVPASDYAAVLNRLFMLNGVYGVNGDFSSSDPSDLDKPLTVDANWTQPGAAQFGEKDVRIGIPQTFALLSGLDLERRVSIPKARYPAFVPFGEAVWDTTLHLPKGYVWKGGDVHKTITTSAGSYSERIVPKGGTVEISRSIDLKHTVYSPDDYPALYGLVSRFTALSKRTYPVEKLKG